MLFDGNGAPIGGTITFDLFYDMNVSTPGSSAGDVFADRAEPAVVQTTPMTTRASPTACCRTTWPAASARSARGHYSWTYTLAAGQAVFYTLSGSAIASAELAVAAVPEPETYALMLLGLAGVGAVARRRRRAEARPTPRPPDAALPDSSGTADAPLSRGVFVGEIEAGRRMERRSNASERAYGNARGSLDPRALLSALRLRLLAERRQAHRRLDALHDQLLELRPGRASPSRPGTPRVSWPSVVSQARPPS